LRDARIGTEPMTVERPLDGLETVDRALGRWVLICQPICINSVYLVLIIVCNERRSALVSLPYLGLAQEAGGRLGKRLGLWHSHSLPSRNTSAFSSPAAYAA